MHERACASPNDKANNDNKESVSEGVDNMVSLTTICKKYKGLNPLSIAFTIEQH